jgi:hypothetical protein
MDIDPEDLAQVSPYLTGHIRRFGEYSTHELADEPDAYDPHLDVDFTPLRGENAVPMAPAGPRDRQACATAVTASGHGCPARCDPVQPLGSHGPQCFGRR